jgi:membrane associated rhomboid family serine protease
MLMSGTALILLATILISVLGLASSRFRSATVLRPYRIAHGSDYETLLMSGFVHADVGHLVLNLVTFYFFGPSLEHMIGTTQFLLLYLCGLLVANIGTVIRHRDDPYYSSLGASGAILAVLFASITYFPQQKIFILPLPVPIPAPLFAVGYLLFSLYSSRRQAWRRAAELPPGTRAPVPDPGAAAPPPGAPAAPAPGMRATVPMDRINHDAHIFGALTGLAYVLIMDPTRFRALLDYFTG